MPNQQYLSDCLDKFYDLPDIVILEFNHPERLAIIDELNDKYGLELSFMVVLVAVGELSLDNIAEYLAKRFDLPNDTAATIAQQMNESYFQPILKRLAFLNQDQNKTDPSPEEEKSIILDIFKEKLLVELKDYEQMISAVNQRIFAWLDRDPIAKKQIETALLQNQEIVTDQPITLNGEKLPGTVTNWLRCFAAEKGADNFDSLSISEFLGLSKNTASLSLLDKKVLSALLNAYRNIKFFPDSMPNDDGTDWAIIPLPKTPLEPEKSESTNENETVGKATQLIDPEMQPARPQTVETTVNPDINNKINQLELMLKRYNQDSLEGQAILEEIAKLKRG